VIDTRDGTSYATGFRIDGQHCRRCGLPDSTPQQVTSTGELMARMSACCGDGVCFGYVTTKAWQVKTNPDRTAWACHRQLADEHLGEPTWLPLGAPST
jgi:hypothetical protein